MPQGKKKEKKIYIGKEEIIPTLFTEDIIIYVENPMTSTPPKKTLELISLSRVQDIRSIYKNHLYFQILTTIRNLNIKNTIYNSFKQYKIFSDKSDKICAISLHRNYKVWLRKGKKKTKEPIRDFPGGSVVKNLPANAGDTGLSPGPGRSHMSRSN